MILTDLELRRSMTVRGSFRAPISVGLPQSVGGYSQITY